MEATDADRRFQNAYTSLMHYRIPRVYERAANARRVSAARLRCLLYSARVAKIGRKCLLGRGARIDRPWTIIIGNRSTFEDDVWLKIEDDRAAIFIGESVFLGRGCEIDATNSVTIGNRVLLAPRVFVTDHQHGTIRGRRIVDQGCRASPVVIGDDAWIGAHTVILPGVTIGCGAVVGAGAVVTKSIPE